MPDYSILDVLANDIVIIGRDHTIIFANRSMLQQCGMTAAGTVIGRKCHMALHGCPVPCGEICLEKKECPLDLVFQTGRSLQVIHHHTCPGGNKKIAAITASPLVNANNEVDMLLLEVRDITTEEAIREKAERDAEDLRQIFNSAPFAISYVDNALRVLKMNPTLEKYAGISFREAQGRCCYELWGKYAGDPSRLGREKVCDHCGVIKALEDGKVHTYEREVAGRFYEILSSPVRNSGQRIVGAMEIGQDITERKMAEISRRRYEQILSTTDDLLSFIDTNYIYRTVNDAYCRAFNKKREEIENHSVIELLGADHFESTTREILDRCLHGEHITKEVVLNIPNLDKLYLDVAYYPFRERDGSVSGIVVNARNISERKLAEEKLKIFSERKNALHNLLLSILEAVSPEEIGAVALAHLRGLISCAGSCIAMLDLEEKITRPLAVDADITPPFFRDNVMLFQCRGCLGKLLNNENVRLTALPSSDPDTCSIREKIFVDGIRAFAAIPLSLEGQLIGVLSMFHDEDGYFSDEHLEIAAEIAVPVAVAIHKSRLHETLIQHGRKLQALTLQMAEIEDNERSRLSRQLHDEAGQKLSALALNLNILCNDRMLENFPELHPRLIDSITLVEQITEQTRDVMADLRPPVLDDYGLGPALRWYCQKISKRSGRPVIFKEEIIPPLPHPLANTMFGIAREAISNAIHHGRPASITLELRKTAAGIRLQIEDDGSGFLCREMNKFDREPHWGLLSMQERMAALGGLFEIKSLPGRGTTVLAEAPL